MMCLVSSLNLKYRCLSFDKSQIKKTGSSIPTIQHISEASLDHYTTTYLQAMVNMKRVVRKKNIHVQYFYNCKAGQNLRLNLDRDCWNRLKRDTKCCQCLDYRDRLHVLFFIRTLYMHQLTFKVLILLTSKGADHQF